MPQLDRMTTPRGCRFRDLGEAHRNITGRSASNSTSRKASSATADDAVNASEDIPLQELSSSRSLDIMTNGRHGFPLRNIQGRSLTSSISPNPRNPTSPVSHAHDDEGSSPLANKATPLSQSNGTGSMPSETSDNTVDRIYRQYQLHTPEFEGINEAIQELSLDIDNPGRSNTSAAADAPRSRDGATNRCGFRSEDVAYQDSDSLSSPSPMQATTTGESRPRFRFPPNDRPRRPDFDPNWVFPKIMPQGEAPTMDLPQAPSSIVADQLSTLTPHLAEPSNSLPPSLTSPPNTEELLYGTFDDGEEDDDARDHEGIYISPLRLHTAGGAAASRFGYLSGCAASTAGMTTESDDDPFKYDNQSYSAFLQPSKEREVSAALRRVSGLSSHSRGTVCSPDGTPYRSSARPPPIPKKDMSRHPLRQGGSPKQPQEAFYDSSAIKSIRRVAEGDPLDIKVVLRGGPPSKDHPTASASASNSNPNALTDKNLGLGEFKGPGREHVQSDGDDWETVATSGFRYGSADGTLPVFNSQPIKTTGSSIADLSDESFYDVPFDDFASTDRIIKHPRSDGSLGSYHVREVKGSNMPVFVARPRVHRVNGLAQDSCRMLSAAQDAANGVTSTAESLGRKISNPFRQLSAKKKQKRRFPPFAYPELESKAQEAALGDVPGRKGKHLKQRGFDGGKDEGGPSRCQSPTALALRQAGTPTPACKTTAENDISAMTHDSERSHGFSFNLIPLPEAARLQAMNRASGLDDQTESGTARARRAMSNESERRGDMASPDLPALPRLPEASHPRRPRALCSPSPSSPPPTRQHHRGGQGLTAPILAWSLALIANQYFRQVSPRGRHSDLAELHSYDDTNV